jgi:hypothetical protein
VKLENIAEEVNNVEKTLDTFIKTGKIIEYDVEKTFQYVSNRIYEKQMKILNDGRLNLNQQRVIFSALRTVKNTITSMHISLLEAIPRHENPITAERCKEMMPFILALSNEIQSYDTFKDGNELNQIFDSARILRRNAKNIGFFPTLDEEFKEINMRPEKINDFLNHLNKVLVSEIDNA